jgi:hypothetical protein
MSRISEGLPTLGPVRVIDPPSGSAVDRRAGIADAFERRSRLDGALAFTREALLRGPYGKLSQESLTPVEQAVAHELERSPRLSALLEKLGLDRGKV